MKSKTKKEDKQPKGVTLVAATPTKPKVRGDSRNYRQASSQSQSRAFSPDLEAHVEDEDGTGYNLGDPDGDDLPGVTDEDEELWLPNSSPDVLLLGARKRSASGSSSSMGLSDLGEEVGMDTPVKKRLRI